MNYVKGDFILVPNKLAIKGLQPSDQAVFMWICSYVNDEGWCFPSRSRLAKDCGMSIKTVDRAMERIIEKGLMTKQIRKKGEKNLSNIYQVLIVENDGVVELCRQGGDKNDTRGGDKNDIENYTHLELKQTNNIGEQESSQIVSLIKMFESINPVCKTYYGNKTQRSACDFLIKEFGFDEVVRVIKEDLPAIANMEYPIQVTTPYELKEKWVKIKKKLESDKGMEIIVI